MVTWKMAKKVPKQKIEEQAKALGSLTPLEAKVLSLSSHSPTGSTDQENPFLVLKYFRDAFECFSAWEKDELKAFSGLITELRQRTWRQVLETSGKQDKKGLAYTPYETKLASKSAQEHLQNVRNAIGEDINFVELRVTQKIRVHGFRMKAAFFLVLLDREHRVFPQG